MKIFKLLSSLLIVFSMITGCIDLSSEDEEELKSFLDGYDEEDNQEITTSSALDKNYIEETEVTESSTTGSAKIGGEIDAAAISSRAVSARALTRSLSKEQISARVLDTISASNFTISFINGKGQKILASISASQILINQPASGNPQFIIEGVGDGVNYIVEVSVSIDGGTPVALKSVASVPKGATKSEKAIINPVSTVIAEAVQEKVKNSFFETGGDSFSQDYISDLNQTMAAIIEEVVSTGTDLSINDFEEALASEDGIESLVSKLLSDENVSSGLNRLEDAAVADTFAVPETASDANEARDIVRELFEENGGGNDATPDFFINFFGDQYAAGTSKQVTDIFDSIFAGIEFNGDVDQAIFNKENALAAFTTQLVNIYDALDDIAALEALSVRTDTQKLELMTLRETVADVPGVILGIFPPERKAEWQALSGSSSFTVPQAITLIFFTLNSYLDELKSFERNDDGLVEENTGVDFNPDPLLLLYGLNTQDAQQASQYASLDINWMQLNPGQIYLQSANAGNGGQVDVLSMFTCVDAFPQENYTINSVTLSYPKKDSTTGTVTLKTESEIFGGDATATEGGGAGIDSCYTLNPWAESQKLEEQFKQTQENGQENIDYDGIWEFLKTDNKIITDFKSGDYVVTVNYDDVTGGNDLTKSHTFPKRLITGLSNLFPKFTSPIGLPRHPEGATSPEEFEAYNTAINNFTMTTFATSTAAVFTWDTPIQLASNPLPEGVVAVYNLDIGRDVCGDDPSTPNTVENHCRWTQIFSSWETGSQIFNTRFELPADAKARLEPLRLNESPYQANLSISFVDETTGEQLGQGGWAQAPFRVGEVLDLNSTFNLTGSVTNAPTDATLLSQYKVAVVKESCAEDKTGTAQTFDWIDEAGVTHNETYYPWVCDSITLAIGNVVDNGDGTFGYLVSPTLKNMMGNNQGSYVDIRMFVDANDNDVLDPHVPGDGTTAGQEGESVFWSMSNVHFNNWGGVLRIQSQSDCESVNGCNFIEEIVMPGESYDGPSFDVNGYAADIPIDVMPAITAFTSVGITSVTSASFNWDHSIANVDSHVVVVVEWDAVNNVEVSAMVANMDSAATATTIEDVLNGTNGATNISTLAVTDFNATEGSNLTVMTSIDNAKTYFWYVEAYDVNSQMLGKSDNMEIKISP